MMNKEELTTLISALRFNANILNEKLGEQENILDELLELQETIAVQLSTLEEELENIDIIDKDKELDIEKRLWINTFSEIFNTMVERRVA